MEMTQGSSGRNPGPIYVLLGATALSMVGNALTFVAIPWFVLQTTGSAAKTGLAAGASFLALVLAGLFGGPVVDRLGFKRSSIVADLASGVSVALIPLLYHTVGLAFWQLLVLVFLGAFLDTPGMTARQSLIPDLSGRARMSMERANSASQAIQRFSLLVGPPLGGILIAAIGTSNVLWLDAATFAVSAAAVAAAIPSSDRTMQGTAREGYFAEFTQGLRFVWRDRPILSIIAAAVLLNFLVEPVFAVVMPYYAREVFGNAVNLGLMLGGFGAGAFAGVVIFGAIGHRLPRRATLVTVLILTAIPFLLLSTTPPLPLCVAAMAVVGLGIGPGNPLIFTVVQERTPPGMLGRVFGALFALAEGAAPLGMVVSGYLLEVAGLRFVLTTIVAGYVIVTLYSLLNPAFREMEKPTVDTLRRDA
ncbi:MAG: MFS transporter [Actinomycetota bacterium]|nr:MFS transporter [Actinomycetota bacterium]